MERVLSVTSAARKRSVQLSAKQLSGLGGNYAPCLLRQSSEGPVHYGNKVSPCPNDDSSDDTHSGEGNGGGLAGGLRGRSVSLGNVLRRPSMFKDIMPLLSDPRRNSVSAAIYPIPDNSMLSGESEHTLSDVMVKRRPSNSLVLSMKSAPILSYSSKSEELKPPGVYMFMHIICIAYV